MRHNCMIPVFLVRGFSRVLACGIFIVLLAWPRSYNKSLPLSLSCSLAPFCRAKLHDVWQLQNHIPCISTGCCRDGCTTRGKREHDSEGSGRVPIRALQANREGLSGATTGDTLNRTRLFHTYFPVCHLTSWKFPRCYYQCGVFFEYPERFYWFPTFDFVLALMGALLGLFSSIFFKHV